MKVRLVNLSAVGLSISLVGLVMLASSTAQAEGEAGSGGKFVPVEPTRIADTWQGTNTPKGSVRAGEIRTIKVTGIANVPSTGIGAVVLDVAGASTQNAQLSAYTGGEGRDSSFLTFDADGSPASNTTIVAPAGDGTIDLHNSAGSTNFNVDVQGYFTDGSEPEGSGGGFVPITPARLVGTTQGIGLPKAKLSGGQTYTVQMSGSDGIASDATAVFANVRVINANVDGGLRIGASDSAVTTLPYAINYSDDDYADTGMTIKLGTDGRIKINSATSGSSVDLIIDVQGYFTPDSEGGGYTPLDSARIIDSQASTPLAAGEAREIAVAGSAGVPDDHVQTAVNAEHLTGNVVRRARTKVDEG